MDDYDWCYECTGYGDDYYYNEDGDMVCSCDTCWIRKQDDDDE